VVAKYFIATEFHSLRELLHYCHDHSGVAILPFVRDDMLLPQLFFHGNSIICNKFFAVATDHLLLPQPLRRGNSIVCNAILSLR
jgi:hypothetical protein